MTRPATRLALLLLTGLFLVQGLGVSPSLHGSVEDSVTVAGTVAVASGGPDAGGAPAGCDDGELPCSPQDGPPPCTVASACTAPAFLPAGFGVAPDASPNDRGLFHPALREPGSVFLERHTPPPRA